MRLIILCFFINFYSRTLLAQDTIPFTLGSDNRIYMKGHINDSDSLNLVFDLGANITVINKTKLKENKLKIGFDSIVDNAGGNGVTKEELSNNNRVTLYNFTKQEQKVLGISYHGNEPLDGIIGWNFFEDKIVRIDYESNQLVIYNEDYKVSKAYNTTKIKYINGLPFIQTIIYKGKRKVNIWSMIDTGYNSKVKVYYEPVAKNNLLGHYQVIGESTSFGTDGNGVKSDLVLLPKYQIAGFQIYNMPTDLIKTKEDKSQYESLLGGALLKRFHIVLDFKGRKAYFMPNILINSKFM